jgi:hypothetical protein
MVRYHGCNSPESVGWMRRIAVLALLVALPATALAGGPKPCVTADQAAKMVNKDVCITAHVYEVVELPDGTRFLDICAPTVADADCRFTIISLWLDRETVGDLRKYRDMDVKVRGTVRAMKGRSEILLSHARQFYGGPPKFRPNPRLAKGFGAERERPAVADPNLEPQGRARSFMNARATETPRN